jgi:uncharacterized protein DUF4232
VIQARTRYPVDLDLPDGPVFGGDQVALVVTSHTAGGPTIPFISSATVDFGDGTIGVTEGTCANRVEVAHAYPQAGDYKPRVTQVSVCDLNFAADVVGTVGRVHVFPAAPTATARWPVCSTFQLHLAAPWSGAGLGNAAIRITMQNVGTNGCTLKGYPDLILVGRNGALLPTHVHRATTGDYMFPAVVPHTVALSPGEAASFMIGYADNEFGPGVGQPYEVACPASIALRVILPDTRQFGTAKVAMGACEGVVNVSPIVPGAAGVQFS